MDEYKPINGFSFHDGKKKMIVATIEGRWLLDRCEMSWRKEDLLKGFQRSLNEGRLRSIASTVLDSHRSFPNAIILSSKDDPFIENEGLSIRNDSQFLIIDGQHRLYSQNFSDYNALFICIFHVGLSEKEMAYLFKEINDKQKKVPASLRWDLIRLIETDKDLPERRAVDILYELVIEDEDSPLYQRVDMTGEISTIKLKQASIAPEFEKLIRSKKFFGNLDNYEFQKEILRNYFIAMKDFDLKSWNEGTSIFNNNRIVRAALLCLNKILEEIELEPNEITPSIFLEYLNRLKPERYTRDSIIAMQGSAGIGAIREIMEQDLGF